MNYFRLFELPVQLKPDKEAVRKKYFELSRKSHPDYFISGSEQEQQQVLEQSALLNKALKTLTHTDETLRYVLIEKGLLQDEEKYSLPPDFLMQMMEINEMLAEAQLSDDENTKAHLLQQLSELEKEIYEPVKDVVEHYQEGITSTEELLQVKDYYFKKKYLNRLRQQLDQK